MSVRSISVRTVGVVALAALIAGCPTGGDPEATPDGGTTDDGGPISDDAAGAGATPDSSTADSAPPPPACGRLTTLCGEGGKCAGAADCVSKVCFGGVCKAVAPADGVKNGDETDVDCGGSKAPACADGKTCVMKGDCTSGVCKTGVCQVPTSTDGVQNGNETGIDCGGSTTAAPKCPAGQGCLTNIDCNNIKCDTVAKKCLPAAHDDGIKNLDETGIDCGGPTAGVARCAPGQGCAATSDCANVVCNAGTLVCDPPSSTDGLKNGTETDIDCGGGAPAPACTDGKGCVAKSDCTSSVCKVGVCQAPTATDGVQNGDETGIDCGGTTTAAPKCPAGQGCLTNIDCNNIKCDTVTKKCLPAAHDDGIKNLDETGIDCGGPTAGVARCAPGQGCVATSDCANVLCAGGVCAAASSSDGLKNGTETDIDCGGGAPTNAGPCKGGKTCAVDTDCTSSACNYTNKCAQARSCRVHMGGDTCGKGEVGQAGAAHEDCCTSVPLNATLAVDKYEITAGRMREFIAKTGGDVATWVGNNRGITGQIADTMVQYLPTDNFNPVRTITRCQANGTGCASTTQSFGVYDHLGNNVFMADRPCSNCGQGCWFNSGAGQNGHPTYYWDDTTQTNQFGAGKRVASQSELDVKSLNCTPQLLFAAFCAWDGGRLPTDTELGGTSGAWGPTGMPWGGTSVSFRDTVAGNEAGRITYPFAQDNGTCPGNSCFVVPMLTVAGGYNPAAATLNSTNFNPFPSSPFVFAARYVYPVPADTSTNDQAYAVAAPGRMRNDFRKIGAGAEDGYYDIAANLMEVTATSAGTDDANHNGWPRVKWVGGSFEGHGPGNRTGYDLSVLTKYGKQGARCVRAIP